jgi:hypothetical protein
MACMAMAEKSSRLKSIMRSESVGRLRVAIGVPNEKPGEGAPGFKGHLVSRGRTAGVGGTVGIESPPRLSSTKLR